MTKNAKVIIGTVTLLVVIVGMILVMSKTKQPEPNLAPEPISVPAEVTTPQPSTNHQIIGNSTEKREIETFTFGNGEDNLLFVGGVHGGYEWNSILLAYEMIDYFTENPELVPKNVSVHIIPNLNPDGLFAATGLSGRFVAGDITDYSMHTSGKGRFNANNVDLNRNFDCKWAPTSSWRGATVSAGTSAFSEPEAKTLRDYVAEITPKTVVFWHSQANEVYASECEQGVLPETLTVMNAYAAAGNYGAVASFDAYPITGDAEGWLASIGIPAITVELGSRTSTEWSQNIAGVNAILSQYGK